MHIAQLLYTLLVGEHNEIIKSRLPDVPIVERGVPRVAGPRLVTGAQLDQKPAGKALLDRLHHLRRIAALRFGQQQVYVLRHDDIADYRKVISPPNLFDHFEQQIAGLRSGEKRFSLVATGGDEVGVSRAVVTLEFVWHW